MPEELEKNIQTPQENKQDKIGRALEMIAKSDNVPGLEKYLDTLSKSMIADEDKKQLVEAVELRVKELLDAEADKLKQIR